MQKDKLNIILQELYILDPSLKEHEINLVKLISQMSDLKPDTCFDAAYAARLKEEILKQSLNNSNKSFIFLKFMNKKIFIAAGIFAVLAIAVTAILYSKSLPQSTISKLTGDKNFEANKSSEARKGSDTAVTKLALGAFGSLSSLSSAPYIKTEGTMSATGPASLSAAGGANAIPGADMSVSSGAPSVMSRTTVSAGVAVSAPASTRGFAGSVSSKMMAPIYNFKYVYKGDPINLSETQGDVYRRVKGGSQVSQDLAQLVKGINYPDLNMNSFDNLKMTSLSLIEDKDMGLMMNFDFNEDSVNIYENWEKWQIPARQACADNQKCWDSYRLKISDVPTDKDLIAMSDKFISKHKINTEHYGEPQVDNQWRENYTATTDKINFYIPESASVIYPLMLNGEAVRDQSGSYNGLRVTINLLKKAASGLSGLTPYRYESSSYDLSVSGSDVIKAAEKGGSNQGWYGYSGAEKTETIELGTPIKVYVQLYKYSNNRNDELLTPALIFPIIKAPEGNQYFGAKQIIVPLVKDMLNDILNSNQGGYGGGGITPMMLK